jgi:hypothetical protein
MSETVRRYPNLATKVYDQHVYQPKTPNSKIYIPISLCVHEQISCMDVSKHSYLWCMTSTFGDQHVQIGLTALFCMDKAFFNPPNVSLTCAPAWPPMEHTNILSVTSMWSFWWNKGETHSPDLTRCFSKGTAWKSYFRLQNTDASCTNLFTWFSSSSERLKLGTSKLE